MRKTDDILAELSDVQHRIKALQGIIEILYKREKILYFELEHSFLEEKYEEVCR